MRGWGRGGTDAAEGEWREGRGLEGRCGALCGCVDARHVRACVCLGGLRGAGLGARGGGRGGRVGEAPVKAGDDVRDGVGQVGGGALVVGFWGGGAGRVCVVGCCG